MKTHSEIVTRAKKGFTSIAEMFEYADSACTHEDPQEMYEIVAEILEVWDNKNLTSWDSIISYEDGSAACIYLSSTENSVNEQGVVDDRGKFITWLPGCETPCIIE